MCAIDEFTHAPRAIINCFKLGEGVDIPCADSVAIMYPKQSHAQITQMVLRAGRAYPGKSRFHILLPIVGRDNMSEFQKVLEALASHDTQIRDEITYRPQATTSHAVARVATASLDTGTQTLHINIETFGSTDLVRIRATLAEIRAQIAIHAGRAHILELCAKNNVDTSIEYKNLQARMPELPENPQRDETWYDFLHAAQPQRISLEDFAHILAVNSLHVADHYDNWRVANMRFDLPTVQHISDGYFGQHHTEFNPILQIAIPCVGLREGRF